MYLFTLKVKKFMILFRMLNNNDFSGSIPPEIGKLSQLHELLVIFLQIIISNYLTIKRSLYCNQLTGELPIELNNLTNVQIM